MSWWESAYRGSPPWDIGAPQPEIVKLVENNEIPKGRILDIGCGTGDNSIFLFKNGFSVTCMDIAHLAIEKGKTRAAKQKAPHLGKPHQQNANFFNGETGIQSTKAFSSQNPSPFL